MNSTLCKCASTFESQPTSHIFVLQFPNVTLKQIAVVGLKQLAVTILTGYGAPEVTFLLILSNRPLPMITLTILLKVRNKQRLLGMTSVSLWSGQRREREADHILCYQDKVGHLSIISYTHVVCMGLFLYGWWSRA